MKNSKKAFTMIELIFVIIILGVLASIAVSKMGNATNVANIANARSDISAIRSAIISERQSQLIKGVRTYIPKLTPNASTSTMLFTGDGATTNPRTLLKYGLTKGTGAGQWTIVNDTTYRFNSGSDTTTFTYNPADGTFDCTAGANECDALVH